MWVLNELEKGKETSEREIKSMKKKIEMCLEQIEEYKELIAKEEQKVYEYDQVIELIKDSSTDKYEEHW